MIFMIFMVVFEAFTNGLKAAILVSAGLECLLHFLDANVGERGGFAAVGADSGFGAGWSWCSCGFVAVCSRLFLLARAFRAFRAFSEL